MKKYFIFAFVGLLAFGANVLSASMEEELIAKMRAHVGDGAALDKVKALQYQGTFTTSTGDTGSVSVSFQAPYYQKIVSKTAEVENVICVGEFFGYVASTNLKTGEQSRNILGVERYESLQMNSVENLNFFKPSTDYAVEVSHLGALTYEGRAVVGIVYSYANGASYQRYVDPQSGRVLATTTERGDKTVESGELVVQGLRFPTTLQSFNAEGDLSNTIEFNSVRINPSFPENFFEYSFIKKK